LGAKEFSIRTFVIFNKLTKSLFAVLLGASAISASATEASENNINNLMVVLRESEGNNKTDAVLRSTGPSKAIVDGKEMEFDLAWYEFIGDMHIRFVYDSPTSMSNLTSAEFAALKLTPEEAVNLAVKNIKRTYGKPKYSLWQNGIMIVEGESPDVDSSYLLDLEFWNSVTKKYPDGVVVAVPKRGGLLFAPASDKAAVTELKGRIKGLFISSERMRVSSALYLYKDSHWSIFQAAIPQ
jgi:uncharacterized protein YtpQ (UPF0354 family)